MSRTADKKVTYRVKQEIPSRFGFEYNESAINYRTEIPPLPEKPRHKPEEKTMLKKISEIDDKIQKLKETRSKKKAQIKGLESEYDSEYQSHKDNVQLARKCILVLQSDLSQISEQISYKSKKIHRVQEKIGVAIARVKQIKFKNRPAKINNKPYEEMNDYELIEEKSRIEQIMTTKTLTKKEESQLNSKLNRIARIKSDPNRKTTETPTIRNRDAAEEIQKLEADIARNKDFEKKLREERQALFDEKTQIELKIEDIGDDIKIFFEKLNEIASVIDSNEHVNELKAETKTLKDNIYKLRQDIGKIKLQFEDKVKEYEEEQEKIKWINWARKIQEARKEEWEEEKAERKRQKLREKAVENKNKEANDGKDTTKKEADNEEKPTFQKKKINRNQKQIDTCSFLLDYCKRLYPTTTSQNEKQEERKEVDIKDQLKKGQWAKEKGVEIIQPKKSKLDPEEEPPKAKFNKKKQQRQEQIVPSNRFSHDYFVAQSFDQVKLLPPSNVEQLDKIVKDLEDKIEYYLSHPEENIEQKFAKDKNFVEKVGQNDQGRSYKNTKTRGGKSSVINSEDFPSL